MRRQAEGKIVLVTGAAGGIGRASALAFAREGARVVVSDVAAEGAEETVRLIRQSDGEAQFVRCDVSRSDEVEALVNKAVEYYGRLDWAHNNAGIAGDLAPTADCSEENWDRIVATNLKGVWLCMKYEIRQMLKGSAGAIVNTSSTAGLTGSRGAPAYSAASHGLIGLTKSAALEYADAGIRVNAVCPGVIRTPMTEQLMRAVPNFEAQALAGVPLRRLGTPEEVAQAVVWLCSGAASYLTGHVMVVDGGRTAR